MEKFKVGDVVSYNHSILGKGTGVVRGYSDNKKRVFVDCFTILPNSGHCGEIAFGDKFKKIMPDSTGWWFSENELDFEECIVEYKGFHVGDRVETIKGDSCRDIGCVGTIVAFRPERICPVYVRFDEKYDIKNGDFLEEILNKASAQGCVEFSKDIKVIQPIIEDEQLIAVIAKNVKHTYTETEIKCIEKIRKLLTF